MIMDEAHRESLILYGKFCIECAKAGIPPMPYTEWMDEYAEMWLLNYTAAMLDGEADEDDG